MASTVLPNVVIPTLRKIFPQVMAIEPFAAITAAILRLSKAGYLSMKEVKYILSRKQTYLEMLRCKSPSQLIMKMSIYQPHFQVIDYVVLFIGFSLSVGPEYSFDRNVLVKMIDDHSDFDDALKMPRVMRMLLKAADDPYDSGVGLKRTIAHILVKFPDLKKMNFMIVRTKSGKAFPRFTDNDIKEYF